MKRGSSLMSKSSLTWLEEDFLSHFCTVASLKPCHFFTEFDIKEAAGNLCESLFESRLQTLTSTRSSCSWPKHLWRHQQSPHLYTISHNFVDVFVTMLSKYLSIFVTICSWPSISDVISIVLIWTSLLLPQWHLIVNISHYIVKMYVTICQNICQNICQRSY